MSKFWRQNQWTIIRILLLVLILIMLIMIGWQDAGANPIPVCDGDVGLFSGECLAPGEGALEAVASVGQEAGWQPYAALALIFGGILVVLALWVRTAIRN